MSSRSSDLVHISNIHRYNSNTYHNVSCTLDIQKVERVIFTRIIISTFTKWVTNDLSLADSVGLEDGENFQVEDRP